MGNTGFNRPVQNVDPNSNMFPYLQQGFSNTNVQTLWAGADHGGDQNTKKSRTSGFSSELNANVEG